MTTTFCTIIAHNFLPYGRVLSRSIHKTHGDANLFVLVVDDESRSLSDEDGFQILRPLDIGLSAPEFREMCRIYSLKELTTSMKPWLLETLIERTGTPVVYLDPDIEVFSSMDDLPALAAEHDIVLTPHTLEPLKRDGLSPSEAFILQAGAYNLGFIAVGPGAQPFLEWWKERLRTDCVMDGAAGFFVDQKWIDLVPSYFRFHILRSPTFNVAYWNADQRPLEWTDGRLEVAGEPLRFFHYSGFDPDVPDELCKYIKQPRVRLADHPILFKLTQGYAAKLMECGYREYVGLPYGLASGSNSGRVGPYVRKVRRRLVRLRELGKQV